jgi:hypothetical protein
MTLLERRAPDREGVIAMRVLGLLALLVALAIVLVVSATTYLRTPSGININVAHNAAGRAADSATTHVREVLNVPVIP